MKASYINAMAGTRINVGLLLAALKKLYQRRLSDHGLYPLANPMVHEAARQTMGEVRRQQREAQSSFEPFFFRVRSMRAKSARVGVSMPEACASFVKKS